MLPQISEFSYGFALTNELINRPGALVTAAPVFASLYQEGQKGGGWDVQIDRPTLPLFLQFKLSHCMKRRSAREVQDGKISAPFYRFHIRPAKYSNQHSLLLELEAKGNEVYYSAPGFHLPKELNSRFASGTVRLSSIWVKPSDIGNLPDDNSHHVAFRLPRPWFVCSEPRPIEKVRDFAEVERSLLEQLRVKGKSRRDLKVWDDLASSVEETAMKRRESRDWRRVALRDDSVIAAPRTEPVPPREPLQRIAFFSALYLESSFCLVSESERT